MTIESSKLSKNGEWVIETRTYKTAADRSRAATQLKRTGRWDTVMEYRDTRGAALHMVSSPVRVESRELPF